MPIEPKIRKTVESYRMLPRGGGVLVAVSGGPDSMALLHLLVGLREEFSLKLAAAHLVHGIRGKDAAEDAHFVAAAAQRWAVPCHTREVDLPRMRTDRGGGNIEAMGRDERYRFFADIARELGFDTVATGHTRDDQAETLLMWFLRGSGRKGLGGLPPVRRLASKIGAAQKISLVRPLIEVSRPEILAYLGAHGVPYCTDRTNFDLLPLRNWIRIELLPQLRERGGARLNERLASLADLLRDEETVLGEMTRARLVRVLDGDGLHRGALLHEPKAIRRRLVRLWIERVAGSLRAVGFDHVEKMLHLIAEGPPQGRLSLPGDWEMVRDYETVRLQKKKGRSKAIDYSYGVPLNGEILIPEAGVRIFTSQDSCFPADGCKSELEELFDFARLPQPLIVRNFRRGDRFQPLGMEGHKKIKDLFIEKKVSLRTRATLPLLVAGDEVLWVPGYGRSEVGKVVDRTKQVLRLRLEPSR